MHWEPIKNFLGSADAVSLIFVFIALPAFYIYIAIEAHKEFAEAVRFAVDKKLLDRQNIKEAIFLIEDLMDIFDLDWWMIASASILMLMIASLPHLLFYSTGSVPACVWDPKAAKLMDEGECRRYAGLLRLYCLLCGLALAFRIGWARVETVKSLRKFYIECAKLNERS